MLLPAACTPPKYATATERELCLAWADSLILPSRADTPVTAEALTRAALMQAAACGR